MLRAYRENNQEMSSSEAFQRSVLTLWEEQLNPSFEGIFSNDASDDPGQVVPGSHPLLWSGYMLIGDSE
jgi:CHAT domain-containing protein